YFNSSRLARGRVYQIVTDAARGSVKHRRLLSFFWNPYEIALAIHPGLRVCASRICPDRGRLIVYGDAAATATNILAHERLYRLAGAADLIAFTCDAAVALIFYELLKP